MTERGGGERRTESSSQVVEEGEEKSGRSTTYRSDKVHYLRLSLPFDSTA